MSFWYLGVKIVRETTERWIIYRGNGCACVWLLLLWGDELAPPFSGTSEDHLAELPAVDSEKSNLDRILLRTETN